jgi:toxin ParE1/3/4
VARVVRSDRSDEDLIEIWSTIASDSPTAADRTIDAIVRRWEQLALHPYSGPARPDIGPGVRHFLTGTYLTLYRMEGDEVHILRVLHGRRRIGPGTLGLEL